MKKLILFVILGLVSLHVQAAQLVWHTDLGKALALAKKENKSVLLDFTGSDWCGYCKKLDAEVYHTAQFQDYAAKNLVLVELDFPHRKQLPVNLKKANDALKNKYQVRGFPTLVMLDANGNKLGQWAGYGPGTGPQKFIDRINSHRK